MRSRYSHLLAIPGSERLTFTQPFYNVVSKVRTILDAPFEGWRADRLFIYRVPRVVRFIERALEDDPEQAGRLLDRWLETLYRHDLSSTSWRSEHHDIIEACSLAALIPTCYWHPRPTTCTWLAQFSLNLAAAWTYATVRPRAHARVAVALRRLGHEKHALRLLAEDLEAAERAPEDVRDSSESKEGIDRLRRELGVTLAAMGETDEALEAFEQVLTSSTTPEGSTRWLSTLLDAFATCVTSGRSDEASTYRDRFEPFRSSPAVPLGLWGRYCWLSAAEAWPRDRDSANRHFDAAFEAYALVDPLLACCVALDYTEFDAMSWPKERYLRVVLVERLPESVAKFIEPLSTDTIPQAREALQAIDPRFTSYRPPGV